jgi:deoxyribodipyrimidine photo-lyase
VIGAHYPAPIVDERTALQSAKERIYRVRASPEARAEAQVVQARHGSRKSGLPQSAQRRSAARKRKASSTGDEPPAPQSQRDLFA